jgi:predicted ArsR family transcriptional regulator
MSKPQDLMTDDKDGHWQKYPQSLFIQALKDEGGEATTSEIADSVGCSRETGRRRMHELEDDGLVESRKFDPVLVWRLL